MSDDRERRSVCHEVVTPRRSGSTDADDLMGCLSRCPSGSLASAAPSCETPLTPHPPRAPIAPPRANLFSPRCTNSLSLFSSRLITSTPRIPRRPRQRDLLRQPLPPRKSVRGGRTELLGTEVVCVLHSVYVVMCVHVTRSSARGRWTSVLCQSFCTPWPI